MTRSERLEQLRECVTQGEYDLALEPAGWLGPIAFHRGPASCGNQRGISIDAPYQLVDGRWSLSGGVLDYEHCRTLRDWLTTVLQESGHDSK